MSDSGGGLPMSQALTIHHDLGDMVLKPSAKVNQARLKKMLRKSASQRQM